MNMMYPRLYLARNLMRDDGVIFITIDDGEVDNLKKICNEVFGEENLVGIAAWEKAYTANMTAQFISSTYDLSVTLVASGGLVLTMTARRVAWPRRVLPAAGH